MHLDERDGAGEVDACARFASSAADDPPARFPKDLHAALASLAATIQKLRVLF